MDGLSQGRRSGGLADDEYVIEAEDVFELEVDARNTWQGTTLRMIMFYDEKGIRLPMAFADVTVTDTMQTFTLNWTPRRPRRSRQEDRHRVQERHGHGDSGSAWTTSD